MTTIQEKQPSTQVQPPVSRKPAGPGINVGQGERIAGGIGGGLLALWGLRHFTPGSLLLGLLGGGLLYRSASGHCPAYQAIGINTARRGRAEPHDFFDHGVHVESAVTIDKPAEELYRFWKDFENLPRFMRHLQSVTRQGEGITHWIAKGPAGSHVEWDARVINDEENQLIAWRSLEGAHVDNAGSVRFVPTTDRGTEVRVVLEYIPPGGRIGAAVAKLFGEEPQQQINEDLRRFKQLMEAGDIPSIQGQPRGTCGA